MTFGARPDLADSLAQVAREINAPRGLDATLQTIVDAAARSLPGIDHVGITFAHSDGTLETAAATDDFVLALDRLQYQVGDGPCLAGSGRGPVLRGAHSRPVGRPRQMIGQAIGIIMERHGLDETRALDYLLQVSTRSNTKVREVARNVVEQANAKS